MSEEKSPTGAKRLLVYDEALFFRGDEHGDGVVVAALESLWVRIWLGRHSGRRSCSICGSRTAKRSRLVRGEKARSTEHPEAKSWQSRRAST